MQLWLTITFSLILILWLCFPETPWQAVGMDQFMQKPVSKDKLRAALDAIMEAEEWRTHTAAPPCSTSGPSLGSPSCGAFTAMPCGVDIKVCGQL